MSVSQSHRPHLECALATLGSAGHLHRGGGLCWAVWPRTHHAAGARRSHRLPETLREAGALAHYPDDCSPQLGCPSVLSPRVHLSFVFDINMTS